MIIDFTRKCNTYNAVSKEELKRYECPKCHTQGLDNHGTYDRWALTLEVDSQWWSLSLTLITRRLSISRGKCDSCKKTHAILPGDIIPYKQYSLETVVTVLTYVLAGKLTVACVEKLLSIPHQIIYWILKQWSARLLRLALLLRDKFHLYTITGSNSDEAAILLFISENMNRAPQAYLRYFKWPMFMTFSQNAIPQKAFIGISE